MYIWEKKKNKKIIVIPLFFAKAVKPIFIYAPARACVCVCEFERGSQRDLAVLQHAIVHKRRAFLGDEEGGGEISASAGRTGGR